MIEVTKDSVIGLREDNKFATDLQHLSYIIYMRNRAKGFWGAGKDRNKAELICLMHSELSEALEGIRAGDPPSEKIPEFTSVEEELADTVIRILDYAGGFDLRLGEAIVAKLIYNANRPHKHGKAF